MKRCFRMILNIVIPLLGLCLVIFLGPRLLHFFMPFVVGWILALLANPLVRFLERRVKLVRRHGSMLIIIAALAIVIGLFYGAGLLVYREMGSFLADAPEIYQSVIAEIENALQNGRKLAEYFPQNLQPPLLAFSDNLDGLFGKLVSRAAEPTVQIAGHVAKSIPNLLVNMVIIILSSYLFLADRESITLCRRKKIRITFGVWIISFLCPEHRTMRCMDATGHRMRRRGKHKRSFDRF